MKETWLETPTVAYEARVDSTNAAVHTLVDFGKHQPWDPAELEFHAVLWYPGLVPNLLSQLTKDEQAQLLEELNYMNLEDRLYYRWYSKEHTGIIRSLHELTEGQFRDGAVARVLAMEFWTRGEAPTLKEFARAWTKAKADERGLLTPEYAYLTDLQHKRAGSEWKKLRKAKAQSALQTLARISRFQA